MAGLEALEPGHAHQPLSADPALQRCVAAKQEQRPELQPAHCLALAPRTHREAEDLEEDLGLECGPTRSRSAPSRTDA